MKKFLAVGLSALMACAMAVVSAGCNIETGPGDDPGIIVTPPEENPDATVELTVGTLGKQMEINLMQEWINGFMKKHKEVSIKITKNMGGMPEIINWTSAGELPDIVWTAGDQHSPYSSSGYFQDLSDESVFEGSTEFFSDFYEALIDSTHYGNDDTGIWFVPRDYNRLVIYVNKTAFAQAKVALPSNDWTWDDFIEICNKLVDAGAKKAVEWKKWRPVYTTMLTNFGGKYLNDDGTLAIESEETEECFAFYQRFYKTTAKEGDPVDTALAIEGEGAGFKSYSGSVRNSIPMIVDVRPQLSDYMATAYTGEWELGVYAFPNYVQEDGSAGYVGTGCSGYGITKACTDETKRQWAWEFLKYCMSEEGYEQVAYLGNIVPALKSLRTEGAWREYNYYGNEIDPDAFILGDAQDIFLNYYNALPAAKQDPFILLVDDLWKNVHAGKTYAEAITTFKNDFTARIAGD